MKKITFMLAFLLATVITVHAQTSEKRNAEKYLSTKGELTFTFQVNADREVANFTRNLSLVNYDSNTKTVKAWANEAQFRVFEAYNIAFQVPQNLNEVDESLIYDVRPSAGRSASRAPLSFPVSTYPTYQEYADQMLLFETTYPTLVDMFSIGTTTENDGKEILFVKISDNVGTDEQEPKLMYTSSMHGDEIAGYPMMLSLIDYILTVYSNPAHADHARIKNLVENTELWINPSANPDGTYFNSAYPQGHPNYPDPIPNVYVHNSRRANFNGWDLNRNYPDNVDGPHPDTNPNYELETQHFMNLAAANHFVLSANFHGGVELVNYPFDNAYATNTVSHSEAPANPQYYTHPDGNWFEFVSVEYATHAQNDSDTYGDTTYMTSDDDSYLYPSPGVTHGAEWYMVFGGRQDYMNVSHQCREITIELSDTKILPESQLENYWYYNRDALLDYLIQGTYGFTGVVKDAVSGNPIDATITIVGHDNYGSHTVTELPQGDYYRPIKAGTYDILYEAPCYQSVTLTNQTIADGQKIILADVLLTPGAVAPSGGNASTVGSTTATVDWNAQTGNTFDFRYREVGGLTWTTISGLTPNTYDITGLSIGGNYEAQVRAICGALPPSAYSSSILFTTQINYCTSSGGGNNNGRITNVTINTINNNTAGTAYSDFTTISTSLDKINSYNYSITKGGNKSCGFAIWIDFNQNGVFTDAGENVATGTSSSLTTRTGSFTLSSTAALGNTRMRVSLKRSGTPTSCETGFTGEVEDYTINITDSTLSTTENILETLAIYPNPFNNNFNIKLPSSLANNAIHVNVYDISGRLISKIENAEAINNTIHVENLDNLANGTYFVKIKDITSNLTVIRKIIK